MILPVDYTRIDSLFNDTENIALLASQANDLLNASMTYRAPEDRRELSFGATNLTDQRYPTTEHNQVTGGVTYGTYSR